MTSNKSLTIAIVAGEHSGDLLGAGLMRAIKSQSSVPVRFVGVGGHLMAEQGLASFFPMDDLAVMGIAEVLAHLPKLLRHRKNLVNYLVEQKPDVMIGIDAPDFNLTVERRLKQKGIATVHYVSPSVWAWRKGRIKGIKKSVDHMLCLLPFEK
ncbi:MAG TPA: lipid-A-disaccharide synthase, partial [Idiomarina sp.]|nr:lipid-A-disaccharide synthase [Idiomarina sp.]